MWRSLGDGKRPTLLCVHGGPDGASSKPYEVFAPLAGERRVVSWDQLGCGESDHPSDPANWRLSRFAEEMDQVRNQLAPGPVYVFGASWGTDVMMEWLFARKPKDVVGVILSAPVLEAAHVEASRRAAQAALSPASAQAFAEANAGRPGPGLAAANAEYAAKYIVRHPSPYMPADRPRGPAVIAAGAAGDLRTYNRAANLPSLTQPVLFLHGEYDWVREADTRYYASLCRNAEVKVVRDAAHLCFLDQPSAVMDAMRTFMRKADRA